jgi:hypothetical protein
MSHLVLSTHLAHRIEWHVEDSGLLVCDTALLGKVFPWFYKTYDSVIFKGSDPTQKTKIHFLKNLGTTYPVTRILDFTAVHTSKLSKHHAVHLKCFISLYLDLTDLFI